MLQGVTQPARIGFLGNEELGAGWSAVFRLENGFATNTGELMRSGTLFNRQEYVGASSVRLGTITLGQQTSFNYNWHAPMGNGFQSSNLLASHSGNLDGFVETTSAQESNVVKYRSPTLYGLRLGYCSGLVECPVDASQALGSITSMDHSAFPQPTSTSMTEHSVRCSATRLPAWACRRFRDVLRSHTWRTKSKTRASAHVTTGAT
ncbi:hypothetical protein WL86_29895 [Burkholderia diffusa]|nr:hypothetical protein WL86_29895 [Burkholderia diffusa]